MIYVSSTNTYGPFLDGRSYSEGVAYNEGEARFVTVANTLGGVGDILVGTFYRATKTNGMLSLGEKVTVKEPLEKMALAREICKKYNFSCKT